MVKFGVFQVFKNEDTKQIGQDLLRDALFYDSFLILYSPPALWLC